MDRRNVLKTLAMTAGGIFVPTFIRADIIKPEGLFGWYEDQAGLRDFIRRHRNPFVSQLNGAIKGTGKGKKAFLHLAYERVAGKKYIPHHQRAPDCVAQAAGLGVDFLASVQIAIKRQPQRWVAKAATEPIYGGSRVEIGGRTTGGGTTGHQAAEWLSRYGSLLRQEYPTGHDFRQYSGSKAVEYGRTGCPDSLEPIAKLHPVKKAAICRSYSDLCDLVYNGMPVMVCSNVGFGSSGVRRRDSEGFLTRKRKPWYHAMLFGGYDDLYRRKGALCFNSWGEKWVSGPTRGPQPGSTFWVDATTVDSMLRQGDSFAFSAYVGFPRIFIPPFVLY